MTNHDSCPASCHSHYCSDARACDGGEYLDHCTELCKLRLIWAFARPTGWAAHHIADGVCGACQEYQREEEQHWHYGVAR